MHLPSQILLEKRGRYDEAASFARSQGEFIEAAWVQSRSRNSRDLALGFIFEGLILELPLGTSAQDPDESRRSRVQALVEGGKTIESRQQLKWKTERELQVRPSPFLTPIRNLSNSFLPSIVETLRTRGHERPREHRRRDAILLEDRTPLPFFLLRHRQRDSTNPIPTRPSHYRS